MKSIAQLPVGLRLFFIALVVFCVWDFAQRVWIQADASSRDEVTFDAARFQGGAIEMADAVKTWLAEREAQRAAAAEAETEVDETPKAPLLDGGMNVGSMRVRVRAIYTAPESGTRFALLDLQSIEQRSVEISEVQQGFTIEGYTLESISVDAVTFRSNEDETLTIPVFDY